MEAEQLREQLAEAIRAGNYEDATRIALDLIEQLEKTIEEKNAENKKLRMKNYFAHQGDEPQNHEEPFRIYQQRKAEDSE